MKLQIANNLSLPLEAVTEKLAFLGRTGSGKTYAAQKLAEEMHAAEVQFVALDPVGKWWSLRLAANGKDPGIPLPVFGGLQGDVPLEPTAGGLIADVIVDRAISAVVDVSQFESDADKARFMTDFGARFYFRKKSAPSAVHLFIEEAQEFVPQHPQRDETRMLHVWTRIQKLGRNFGIGTSLLSQRPQEVNKKVLNQTEVLFVFQLTGPQERKTIAGWIEEKGINEDIAGELPKLERGKPHAWSPAWLQISKVVEIGEKWTFDASMTPKVGKRATVKELAPIDIEQLGESIKASRERAKADDPRELRKQIADLKKQLAGKVVERVTPAAKETRVEVSVLKDGQLARLEKIEASIGALSNRQFDLTEQLQGIWKDVRGALASVRPFTVSPLDRLPPVADMVAAEERRARVAATRHAKPEASRHVPRAPNATGDVKLNRLAERKVLQVLAVHGPRTKRQLAIQAGYAVGGGGFLGALSKLKTAGLIHSNGNGLLTITDDGTVAIGDVDPLPTGSALVAYWLQQFNRLAEREVLRVVVDAYPDALSADVIASRTNPPYEPKGGGFLGAVSKLRTLGLIEGRGMFRASDDLF